MQWLIAGLGNPESAYDGTRHNIGRDFLRAIAKKEGADNWKEDKKSRALVAKGSLFGKKTTLALPEMYMNNSGASIKALVPMGKKGEGLIIVHDELDLPLGSVKLSFGSGAGGHKGVDSIQKALKTKDFIRVRVGISPATVSGKLRKPDPTDTVDFVLGKFRPAEQEKLKKVRKMVEEALELILTEGLAHAMTQVNSS